MKIYQTTSLKNFLNLLWDQEYQGSLKAKMKRSDLVFDSVDALYYKIYKISLNRGGSYIDSLKWLKDKKTTINPKNNKDDKCFQYAIATALNHQQINNHPERRNKIKPFINKYNWKEIHFPSHK